MGRLQQRYDESGVDGLRLVSITVDPEYDTPERLQQYAESHGVDPRRWVFLTGDPERIRQVVQGGFKTFVGEPQTTGDDLIDIAHSGKFVLVDGQGGIRGYYDSDELGLDEIYHRSLHVLKQQRR
jgi:protein SCO1/2